MEIYTDGTAYYELLLQKGQQLVVRPAVSNGSGGVEFYTTAQISPVPLSNVPADILNALEAKKRSGRDSDGHRTASERDSDGQRTVSERVADAGNKVSEPKNTVSARAKHALQFVPEVQVLEQYYERFDYLQAFYTPQVVAARKQLEADRGVRIVWHELKNIPKPILRELETVTGESRHSDFYTRLWAINAEVESVRLPRIVELLDRLVISVTCKFFSE